MILLPFFSPYPTTFVRDSAADRHGRQGTNVRTGLYNEKTHTAATADGRYTPGRYGR